MRYAFRMKKLLTNLEDKANFKIIPLALVVSVMWTPEIIHAEDGPPPKPDWDFQVGGGTIYTPAFVGSKTYQLLLVPELRIAYKDKFFASEEEGVGYNLLNRDGWRAGPLLRYEFGRNENGSNPFRIAGPKSDALQGLGSVSDTIELGGFTEYTWKDWSARIELLQGVNGDKGFLSNLSINYSTDISHHFYKEGPPLIVSIGPVATLVDGTYNQAYFSVNSTQSANSGLPEYNAGGGLLSYGIAAIAIIPIAEKITCTIVGGYDRLSGDAADSPLVTQRGSPNQATISIYFTYEFGFNRHAKQP